MNLLKLKEGQKGVSPFSLLPIPPFLAVSPRRHSQMGKFTGEHAQLLPSEGRGTASSRGALSLSAR